MERRSVAEYLRDFLRRGREVAYVQRRGYRTVQVSGLLLFDVHDDDAWLVLWAALGPGAADGAAQGQGLLDCHSRLAHNV